MKNYETEARERWGNTDTYREYEQVADERFKKNIDKYGKGTAEFAAEAIEIYFRGK